MDYKAVEQLIKALSDSTVNELEIETSDIKIKMSKSSTKVVLSEATVDKSNSMEAKENSVVIDKSQSEIETSQVKEEMVKSDINCEDLYIVKSPMVGTFYSAPSENSDPFVKPGVKVEKGSILCIVEAMKLMNEIEGEVEGTVVEVLAKNGQMVEYGEPLFKIKL
jgi:acetyl-CoA carboxylase biotin carboxyl carrier protein